MPRAATRNIAARPARSRALGIAHEKVVGLSDALVQLIDSRSTIHCVEDVACPIEVSGLDVDEVKRAERS